MIGLERRHSIMDAMKSMILPVSASEILVFMGDCDMGSMRYHLRVLVNDGWLKEVKDGRNRLYDVIDRSNVGRRKGNKSGNTDNDMLNVLSDKAICMKDVSNSMGLTVSGVSYHLRKLIDDGKVGSVYNGKVNLYYRIYSRRRFSG